YKTARSLASSVIKAVAGIRLTCTAANYSLLFFIAFALSVLPLLVGARYVKENSDTTIANDSREPSHVAPAQESEIPARTTQVRPKVLPFVGLGFLIASTAEMLNGLFPVLATEYAGLSKAQAGIVYTVSTLAIIFSGPIFGWLSDNVSRNLVRTVRGIANTLSSIVYVVVPTFAGVAVAKTADDMGKAAFRSEEHTSELQSR